MKYTKGKIGRVFVLKFEDDDIVIDTLAAFIKKERIKSATLMFIGALKEGEMATGPQKPIIPPEPNWVSFRDGWEVMGIGTVFSNKKGPQIHIHGAMGKKLRTLIGCVRKKSRVFLVLEVIVYELKGVKASKDIDRKTGLNLLAIG